MPLDSTRLREYYLSQATTCKDVIGGWFSAYAAHSALRQDQGAPMSLADPDFNFLRELFEAQPLETVQQQTVI